MKALWSDVTVSATTAADQMQQTSARKEKKRELVYKIDGTN